ncbi:putative 28S rRNA (cytosine-C(5))-methyltransferase [Kappamyces sp. JEL0680]|nr:putative 28S rRNA (cytosine-C(5))-methyltransferase [Kappamyces sp. JEL0680]
MEKQSLRPYHSDPAIQHHGDFYHEKPLHAQSEPVLFSQKRHPLLEEDDDSTPHSYNDYLFAAETLENIVNEGAFVGTIRTKFKWFAGGKETGHINRDMSDRVLKLFLDSLGLVKVMLFDLMKHHFNFKAYPGIRFELPDNLSESELKYQRYSMDVVKDLLDTMFQFQVKLGAAYARLRIEKQASGDNAFEQMHNILPESVRSKEDMAVDMLKTLRVNSLKCSRKDIAQKLQAAGYKVCMAKYNDVPWELKETAANLIYLDDDFDDLLVIPSALFSDIKSSALVRDGYLIFQDKASMYCPLQMKDMVKAGDTVLDARAGCGTKIAHLSEMVGKKGHVFAFEHRPARLETLRLHLEMFGCKNVTIVEDEFALTDAKDARFKDVTTIVVEPVNSGTMVVDKLSHMLQEEEYPVDHLTQKDLYTLKRQQTALLKHAFKFPKAKNILYVTRSIHSEENEQVIRDTLDRYGVEWRLSCVLPDIPSDQELTEQDIQECLTIHPSEKCGNGIFIANFQLKPLVVEVQRQEDPAVLAKRLSEQNIHAIEAAVVEVPVRKKKPKPTGRKRGEHLKIRLPKLLRESVERLSIPRMFKLEKKVSLVSEKRSSVVGATTAAAEESAQSLAIPVGAPDPKPATAPKKVFSDTEITVFGMNVEKFYSPRKEALDLLQKKEQVSKARWKFPVPNPSVWK